MRYFVMVVILCGMAVAQASTTTCQTFAGMTYCDTVQMAQPQPIDLGVLRPLTPPQIDYSGWYMAMAIRAVQPPQPRPIKPKVAKQDRMYFRCLEKARSFDERMKCPLK